MQDIEFLIKSGVTCTYFGIWNGNSVKISPELLAEFDVIITIGKTTQYALALGIPCYNYGRFGGSGFITLENIDIEEAHNFSGRSFCFKKTGEQIINEIMTMTKYIKRQCCELKQIAAERYKLSKRIDEVIKMVESLPHKMPVEITKDNRLYFNYCKFIVDFAIENNLPEDIAGWKISKYDMEKKKVKSFSGGFQKIFLKVLSKIRPVCKII